MARAPTSAMVMDGALVGDSRGQCSDGRDGHESGFYERDCCKKDSSG